MATIQVRGATVTSSAEPEVRDVIVEIVLDARELFGTIIDPVPIARYIREQIRSAFGKGWTCDVLLGLAYVTANATPKSYVEISVGGASFLAYHLNGGLDGLLEAYGGKSATLHGQRLASKEEIDAALRIAGSIDRKMAACEAPEWIREGMLSILGSKWSVVFLPGEDFCYAIDQGAVLIMIEFLMGFVLLMKV